MSDMSFVMPNSLSFKIQSYKPAWNHLMIIDHHIYFCFSYSSIFTAWVCVQISLLPYNSIHHSLIRVLWGLTCRDLIGVLWGLTCRDLIRVLWRLTCRDLIGVLWGLTCRDLIRVLWGLTCRVSSYNARLGAIPLHSRQSGWGTRGRKSERKKGKERERERERGDFLLKILPGHLDHSPICCRN